MANQSQAEARPAKVLAVTSLAAFMASLDLFIVNVASTTSAATSTAPRCRT